VQVLAGSDIDEIAISEKSREQALHRAMAVHQGKIVDAVLQAEIDPL